MARTIAAPAKGEPLRAAWAAEVTDAVNAVRMAGFTGTLCRDGAGASGNAPLPANRRDRRAGAADLSCFHLTTVKAGDEIHAALGNPFYKAGAVLRWIGDGAPLDIEDKFGVICLKVATAGVDGDGDGAAELECCGTGVVGANQTVSEAVARDLLKCRFKDLAYELHPLYYRQRIEREGGDVTGVIVVDFRNAPTAQKVELL